MKPRNETSKTNGRIKQCESQNFIPKSLLRVRILKVKSYFKNTLHAYIDFELVEIGLIIYGVGIHVGNGDRWLSFPGKQIGGRADWVRLAEFRDRAARARLQAAIFSAYDKYVRESEASESEEEMC